MKKSTFTFSLLTVFIFSYAQIVHVNPNDTTIVASSSTASIVFELDIDQDGSADLSLSMMSDFGASGMGLTGTANFVSGSFSSLNGMAKEPSWGDAFLFSTVDSIGANLNSLAGWTDFTDEVVISLYLQGVNYGYQWGGGVTDGYLGIKFAISGNLHYGWIRMDVPDSTIEMTIKDWAYNSTPNATIMVGDTGTPPIDTTSIKEYVMHNELTLYPSLTNGIVEFKNDINTPVEVSIYNYNGELVRVLFIERTKKFDISDLNKGLYLVRIKTSDKCHTQKILLH